MDNKVKTVCNYKRRTLAKVMEITDEWVKSGDVILADEVTHIFATDYFDFLYFVNEVYDGTNL